MEDYSSDKDFHTEELPNHGRGKCSRVVVVWKLNMLEGIKELYCIAQNPTVAKGIREQYREEAIRYGIEPKYYITWEDRAVIWSRTVFDDRYRLYDVDNKKIIWAGKNSSTGEFKRREGATRVANQLIKDGKLKHYMIQKWNRQRRRWDELDPHARKKKSIRFSGRDERGREID